jgi:hypothetical protein
MRRGIDVGLQASSLAPTHYVPNTIRTLACANECVDPSLAPVTPEVVTPEVVPSPPRCLAALLAASAGVSLTNAFVLFAFGVQSIKMGMIGAFLLGATLCRFVAATRLLASRFDQAIELDAAGTAVAGLAAAATLASLVADSRGGALAVLLLVDGPLVLLVPIRSERLVVDGWRSPLTVLAVLSAAASMVLFPRLSASAEGLRFVGLLVFHLCTVAFWVARDPLARRVSLPWLDELGCLMNLGHTAVVGAYVLLGWLF